MKKVKRYLFLLKVVVPIVLIVFLILPLFIIVLDLDITKFQEGKKSNVPFMAKGYIENARFGKDGIYFVKQNEDTGEEEITTVEELWEELKENGSAVTKYLNSADELENLINAEVVTQFPKIGVTGDKLDGTVEFERRTTEGETIKLTYTDEDSFNKMVESEDLDIVNYFTIDKDFNALIASIDTITETLEGNDSNIEITDYSDTLTVNNKDKNGKYELVKHYINVQTVNYRSMISQYTMPFEYLWSITVVCNGPKFALALADLVQESEITISVFDNIQTSIYTDTFNYNIQRKVNTDATVQPDGNYGVSGYNTVGSWEDVSVDETDYKITHTIKYEINTPVIDVTKANVWIVDYSKDYEYQARVEEKEGENSKVEDDTEYAREKDSPKTSYNDSSLLRNGHALNLAEECRSYIQSIVNAREQAEYLEAMKEATKNVKPGQIVIPPIINHTTVSVSVTYVRGDYFSKKINRSQNTKTTQYCQNYIASTPQIREKVEKDANEVNFVTLLSSSEHRGARKNILSATQLLFQMLQQNDDTNNMVDLTKYLLYKVTGDDYGVTEYDFSEYESTNFNSVTASGDISLTTTIFTKEEFIEALKAYSNKGASGHKANFDANFLSRAADIYDYCVDNGFNPELVITFALKESGYDDAGTNNFWGLETPNGSSLKSYSSFEEALNKLCDVWAKYMPGASLAPLINQKAAERQAADCNTNGYGSAGTLKGAISVYSDLCGSDTKHREGSSSSGGNYILKIIYASEFNAKCGNVHKIGIDDYTIQEKADYTAWLYEKQLEYWNTIFGDFGTLPGATGNFVRYYQSGQSWSKNSYNYKKGGTIGSGGCGACALAMAVTGLTGNKVTPDIIVSFLNSQNTNTVYNGEKSSKLVADKYGLTYDFISRSDKEKIDAALDQGKCLIFSINYNGIYTGEGHFIMCYKRDQKGYYVLESGKYYDESKPYAFSQVFTPGTQGIFALGR